MASLRQSGMTLPNVAYSAQHIDRTLKLLAKLLKPRQQVKLAQVLTWAGVRTPKRYAKSMRPLIWAASRNPHANGYHHQWHNLAVMISAALLAQRAGLKKPAQAELIIAAMLHDLDHRGRFMSKDAGGEERRSAKIAASRMFGRCGSDGMAWRNFITRIEATSFTGEIKHDPNDHVAALLLDADIFASCFLPMAEAKQLTKGVMREQSLNGDPASHLSAFINSLSAKGFAHAATSIIAAELPSDKHAAFIDKKAVVKLGFGKAAS